MFRFFCLIVCIYLCQNTALANVAVEEAPLSDVYAAYQTVQQFCGGISDRISKISGVAKANTVVTAVGTASSGGALAFGVIKAQTDKKIQELQKQICDHGGCSPDAVEKMSDAEFLEYVVAPFVQQIELDRELQQLQQRQEALVTKSKNMGIWRTGLMTAGVGTNIASAIIAGLNRNQSDLIQQITACNMAVEKLRVARSTAINNGASPIDNPILGEFNNTIRECGTLNIDDVEKIEKRMTTVMGTSIGGAVIGAIGAGTSIAANTDAVRNNDTESGKQTEKTLNTTANVSAGLATVTGAVGTGVNISLITLVKKILKATEQCEATL